MPLAAGTRLGPYEILGSVGAGGMGEVYRARDPRLARDVAIKVLRSETGLNDERRRRFEIEARAASSLNHPNILSIFDFGEEDGAPYIVSEFLIGETLREVIERGALPIRTLLDLAVQIADGLAAAHAAGITHRDLKPENLFLSGGRVKILDFGLAKAVAPSSPGQATETLNPLTSPGNIVGTIAYMSPEQAQGRPLDYRSDQFSFGSVLYELATGKRPFDRADRVTTMMAIVKEEPAPLNVVETPVPLRWIVERCLAKEPSSRFASTAGLHEQLRDLRDHLADLTTSRTQAAIAPLPPRRRLLPALLIAAAAAAGFLLAIFWSTRAAPPPSYRYTPFATEAADESQPAWSPDGQTLAYLASVDDTSQVFTRTLNSALPAQLTRSKSDCLQPFWSPDGSRIYYWSQESLWSVGAAGGAPQIAIRNVEHDRGPSAAISPDGKTLAFLRRDSQLISLYIQTGDGSPAAFKTTPFPSAFRFTDSLSFSHDGSQLFISIVPTIDVTRGSEIWSISHPGGVPRQVPFPWGNNTRPRTLACADSRHCVVAGERIPGSGNHLYRLDAMSGATWPITGGAGEEQEPALSPDGRRIAYVSGANDFDLVEISLDGSKVSPLLATSRTEYSAAWSPSGLQYAYVTNSSGMPAIWIRSIAEGWARPFAEHNADGYLDQGQPRFSPDGQRLAYVRVGARHAVYVSNLSGGQAVPIERQTTDQHTPAWSPDGNWIAYSRYVGQKWEVAKAPSGGGGQPVRLADGGGTGGWIEWSPAGTWIAVRDLDGVELVPAEGGPARRVHGPCSGLAFSRDGSLLFIARRAADRHWELATIAVPDGAVIKTVDLNLPRAHSIRDLSLRPDGSRLVISVGSQNRDIWILDDFDARR